jgi:hypothetical protein
MEAEAAACEYRLADQSECVWCDEEPRSGPGCEALGLKQSLDIRCEPPAPIPNERYATARLR